MLGTHQGRTHRRAGRMLALLGGLALLAAACGNGDDGPEPVGGPERPDPAAIAGFQESGVTLGIANERPFGFEEDGEATGAAPELARAVLGRLDVEVTGFEVVDFNDLIDALNDGDIDVIAAGMFVTPERAERVLLANPDYCMSQSFAVPEGNPDGLSDFESVADAGIRLGVGRGFVEIEMALSADVPDHRLEVLERTADLFEALEIGRVDTVALTRLTVEEEVASLDGFEATEGFFGRVDGETALNCGGFGFRAEDQALRDAFNDALAQMQADGEVLPVVEPFGFLPEEVDLAVDASANQLAEGAYDALGDPPFDPDRLGDRADGTDDQGG